MPGNKYFKRGAWLHTMKQELSEKKFIEKAGGIDVLLPYQRFPFVTMIIDKVPTFRGHMNGRVIKLQNTDIHHHWQTMEWK